MQCPFCDKVERAQRYAAHMRIYHKADLAKQYEDEIRAAVHSEQHMLTVNTVACCFGCGIGYKNHNLAAKHDCGTASMDFLKSLMPRRRFKLPSEVVVAEPEEVVAESKPKRRFKLPSEEVVAEDEVLHDDSVVHNSNSVSGELTHNSNSVSGELTHNSNSVSGELQKFRAEIDMAISEVFFKTGIISIATLIVGFAAGVAFMTYA